MEFIKAEEFLGQPIEVQKVLLEWWKPSEGDLVYMKETLFEGSEMEEEVEYISALTKDNIKSAETK